MSAQQSVAASPASSYRLGDRIPLPGLDKTLRLVPCVEFPEEREPELIELLRRAFNGGPSWFHFDVEPVDHLRWKTRDYPALAYYELTEDGDQLIGMEISYERRYWAQGREILVGDGMDLALEPEFQGRGINRAAGRTDEERKSIVPGASFQLSPDMHPTSQRLRGLPTDQRYLGNEIRTYARLLRPLGAVRHRRATAALQAGVSHTRQVLESRAARRFPTRRLVDGLGVGAAFARGSLRPALRLPGLRRRDGWSIEDVRRFDERADRLWEQARSQFDVAQVRDATYLNWRFGDPRAGGYITRAAFDGDELLGYAATTIDGRAATLADLFVLPGRDDVTVALIADSIRIARTRHATVLRSWMAASHPYQRALRAHGFARYRTPLAIEVNPWSAPDEAVDFLTDPRTRVHFMTADTDHR